MPKRSCYTEQEILGIKSLIKKRKEGVVICGTDKSQSCGVLSEEDWLRSLKPHTKDDQVVAMDEVDLVEKKLMGVSFQLA